MTSRELSARILEIVAKDRTGGRLDSLKAELLNPEWRKRGYSYHWTGFVHNDLRAMWPDLPLEMRAIIFMLCDKMDTC